MGSLPNLHELDKEKLGSPVFKPAPIGCLGPIRLPPLPPHTHKRGKRTSGSSRENDAMLEHMAAYSPISCRSTRISALPWRRRDSMNSTAGASSVHRLIAAVRTTPAARLRPRRGVVIRHIVAVLLGHASCSAATLLIFPLQAGLGAFEPRLGPMLLALFYLMATATSCFAPIVVQRLGPNLAITASHVVTAIFVGVHLYPKWYILAPSYAMLGCCVSSSFLARTSHVNWCATSMALVCCVSPEDPDETRRECLLRRLNRGIKLAEDIGLAIGCLIATILISLMGLIPSSSTVYSDMGEVCGAEYCSGEMYFYNESLPTITSDASTVLVSIWLGLAILGFFISCAFLDYRMQKSLKHDCKCVKDILKSVKCAFQDPKLQLAAPLTFFIGLEQGFIYDDFMEAYVGCTLGGARTVAVCFLTLAFLQAVATVTLSMLLRHVADKRYFVVAVGFAFHFVLLLLLLVWKPTRDDPAVFYVISAAWGLCNSIWETLIYTLVMGLYPNSWQGPLSTSLFWRWLGLTLALGLHGVVCTRYRVIGLGTMLVMTVVPHLWLEICLARRGTTLAPL